ncbi:hypothetical protein P4C99_08050 [Pontiellaceae bacterium B1224]|nr:hypothetical protein [Pontiellaceae bacterium B1224]
MTKYKYHFVGNIASGDDLEKLRVLPWDEGSKACVHHAWTWPVYCRLRDLGHPVSYSYELKRDAINFIHGEVARYQLKGKDFASYFIVGLRADFHAQPYANLEVVQNEQSEGARAVYMPHLPQPGLLSRDADRIQVENICFSGQLENLGVPAIQLENDLQRIGCRFVYKELGSWNDMRDVDVLLGIRSFGKNPHHTKPPTKMFNAWLSNIPFIGGYDSAFLQSGQVGENYIRISSYDELLAEITKLKEDEQYYSSMVDAGKKASESFTPDSITKAWANIITEVIDPAFHQWLQHSWYGRLNSRFRGIMFDVWEQQVRGYKRSEIWGS